jgi:DNA-binding HxlR family transcriptional regulator
MSMADNPRCSVNALKLVADYWVLRIVEELSIADGPVRFSELQRALGGASPATLSNRLRKLEDKKLIVRQDCPGALPVSYSLSDRGQRILPILGAITDFATADAP